MIVTFDDIPPGENITFVPDGYAGFNWDFRHDSNPLNPILYEEQGLTVGDINYDGNMEVINAYAQEFTYLSRADGGTFDFISFKAMDWYPPADAESLILTGYSSGEIAYTQNIFLSDTMTSFEVNFGGIDRLEIQTNAQDGWYDFNRGHFWMDDLFFFV